MNTATRNDGMGRAAGQATAIVTEELAYERMEKLHPIWAETHATYAVWKARGRPVKRGARASRFTHNMVVGYGMDPVTGEDTIPFTRAVPISIFGIDQTFPVGRPQERKPAGCSAEEERKALAFCER